MGRRRLHDDALRDRLLEHAARIVSDDGMGALNVRALAQVADTSTAAVYSLFGGKPGLLRALYERAFQQLGDGQAAVGVSDEPLEDVVRLGLAYRSSAVADPHAYRVMFGDDVRPSQLGRHAARVGARTFEPLLDATRRAVESGAIASASTPESIATALWANVHGLVSLELGEFMPPQAGDPAQVFEAAVRATVRGWAVSA